MGCDLLSIEPIERIPVRGGFAVIIDNVASLASRVTSIIYGGALRCAFMLCTVDFDSSSSSSSRGVSVLRNLVVSVVSPCNFGLAFTAVPG